MKSTAHIRSHPLHPILVTFPIAFFTGVVVFDIIGLAGGMYTFHAFAYYLCWAGIAGAVLAAVPGVTDYLHTVPPRSSAKKRAGRHGLINVVVLLIFCFVTALRREGFEWYFIMPELAAVALMTWAGWMGGTLVHRNQIGVDHRYAAAGKWTVLRVKKPVFPLEVAGSDELKTDQMKLLVLDERRIVLGRTADGYVAFDDRCTHRGGSLAGGVMMCGTVHCPWHGSHFDVKTGECLTGPANEAIAVYPVREENGKVLLEKIL